MRYPWKRYWLERGASISFLDQGFLYDPAAEGGQHINPGLMPLSIRPEVSCTILLGEPGMGKSSEMNQLRSLVPSTESALALNLRSYGDETRLVNAVFGSRQIRKWKAGEATLHLFLDSLDECLLRIDTVAAIMADELAALSPFIGRLRFHVACRTAPWPDFLETTLFDIFGKHRVQILEIAPLLKRDVRVAAEKEGISNPDDFVRGVISAGAVSLAMKPVTLKFLIGSWRQRGTFPTNLVDLYQEGCRRLCEEDSPSRRSSPRFQSDSRIRFATASRIAALTQIGNRFAIWTGRPSEKVPEEDVSLHELAGEDVDEKTIRDTLDTGLFSARGRERIGWAHLTYAEYLAGSFCNTQRLSLNQLRTLFFHPNGTGLVPQLAEVAAWAALENAALLSEIAKADPESLLNAGLDGINDAQKRSIVDGLLAECRRGKYLHFNWSRAAVYSKLKHPRLVEQLRDELSRRDSNIQSRYMAMSLGQSCKEQGLCREAVQISLDDAEELNLRQLCVLAIVDLGSRDDRKALEPLLVRASSGAQLRAYVVDALWPSIISTEEIFAMLPHWGGLEALGSFLHGRFRQGLGREDLKPAFDWAKKNGGAEGTQASLVNEVLQLGWEHVAEEEICELLADAVVNKLGVYGWFATSIHGNDFQKLIDSDDRRRRILLRALLSRLQGEDLAALHYPLRLAHSEDVLWLLDQFGSFDQKEQDVVINFLRLTLDRSIAEHMTALWHGCQSWPALAESFGFYFRPVPLDGEEAKFERVAMNRRLRKGALWDPSPAQRLLNAIARSEGGDVNAWLVVVQELTLREDSVNYGNFHEASILTMPGWISSDERTRNRIVKCAERYLDSSPFFGLVWPAGGSVPPGAFAVAQALWICLQTDSSFINDRPDLAQKCVQSVARFHVSSQESTTVKQELLRQLAVSQEAAVRNAVVEEVCSDNDRHGYYLAGDSVAAVWNPALGLDLIGLLHAGRLKPTVTGSLLTHVFELSSELARDFASSTLLPHADNQPLDETAKAVALAWMKGDPHSAWSVVWPLMRKDIEFGNYMIAQLGSALLNQPRFLSVVDVTALGDFYLWMVNRYPYPENEGEDGSGPRPVVFQHYLRDISLEHLKQRGTFAAVAELHRVMDELPQYGWLRFHLDQADRIARASTWIPFSIKELESIVGNPDRRLVGSERDLLEVLCESLERLQLELLGETPTVRFLWNTDVVVTPKGEEDLSDFVKAHFCSDIGSRGLVVNREVQIRRSNPGGVPGQRTDILVSAISLQGSAASTVSVIIEVKACWNPEVLVAMRTQLRDRYLRDNTTRTGLYLAGWYACPAWATTDGRRHGCGALKLKELRAKLEHQAQDLTGAVQLKSVVLDCSLG